MKYAENTTVSTEKSRVEIERTLTRYGATGFMYGWQGARAAVQFDMKGRRVVTTSDRRDLRAGPHAAASRRTQGATAMITYTISHKPLRTTPDWRPWCIHIRSSGQRSGSEYRCQSYAAAIGCAREWASDRADNGVSSRIVICNRAGKVRRVELVEAET